MPGLRLSSIASEGVRKLCRDPNTRTDNDALLSFEQTSLFTLPCFSGTKWTAQVLRNTLLIVTWDDSLSLWVDGCENKISAEVLHAETSNLLLLPTAIMVAPSLVLKMRTSRTLLVFSFLLACGACCVALHSLIVPSLVSNLDVLPCRS